MNSERTTAYHLTKQNHLMIRPVGATLPAVEFRRVPKLPLTASMLAEYVGSYTSTELGVTYDVVRTDSTTLVMRTRWSVDRPLTAVTKDLFQRSRSLLAFERDRRGAITGFAITDRRSRAVRFVKVPAAHRKVPS